MSTYYDDMKGDKNAKTGVVWSLGSPNLPNVIGNIAIGYSAYDFLFDFRNYASILYRFQVISCFSSKMANFNPPHLPLSTRRG